MRGSLPGHLIGVDPEPFAVVVALQHGLTRKQLRGRRFDRSVYGVRLAQPDPSLLQRCRMFAMRLAPDVFFSHTTAAMLLGAPLPLWAEHDRNIHITFPVGSRAPHANGVRGHELTVSPRDVQESRGLRLTSAARTWCDLATVLTLDDLVAVGDYFIHWRSPLCSREELAFTAREFLGRRGMKNIRAALPALSDRSESRPESHLRLIFSRGNLPEPRVNYVIVNTESGSDFRTDFAFDEYKVLVEYQGDYHRTKEQWRKDMTRRSRLEAQHWFVIEINADDLRNPDELVGRVRSVLIQHGWRH